MIREATPYDIPTLVELGQLMHAESPRFRAYPFNRARAAESIGAVMHHQHGLCLVADRPLEGVVGGLLAVATPHYACDYLVACDLALFVDPEHRGGTAVARLVKGYVEWARSLKAEPNLQINTGVQRERTEGLFEALGGQNTGSIWTWG